MSEDGLETVAEGAALVFAGRVLKLGVAFLTQVLLARLLGAADYGGVVIAGLVVEVGAIVAAVGLNGGLLRQFPRHETDTPAARGVVRAGVAIALGAGAAVGAAVVLAAPALSARVFDDPALTPLVRLAGLAIPFTVLAQIGVSVARAAGDARAHVVARQLLEPTARAALVAGLVVAGYGAFGAMVGTVLAAAVVAAAALALARRALPFTLRGATRPAGRSLLLFSLPLLLASSVDFLVVNTDTLLLGALRSADDVGVYYVVVQLRQLGLFFFYPVTFLLPTVLARFARDDRHERALRTYQVVSKWLVVLTAPLVVVLFLFPGPFLSATFGESYVVGRTALRVLLIPVMVTALLSANGAALIALGHNRINLYVNAGAAVVNGALNLVLIPAFGVEGAAVAAATAFVSRDVVYTVLLYRWEGLHPFSRAMLRPFAATLAVGVVGHGAVVAVGGPSLTTAVAFAVVVIVGYVPLVLATGAVEREDRRLLAALAARVDAPAAVTALGRRFD